MHPLTRRTLICDRIFGVREGNSHPTSPVFTRFGPIRLFSVSQTQISSTCTWKDIQLEECALGSAIYQYLNGIPTEEYELAVLPKVDLTIHKHRASHLYSIGETMQVTLHYFLYTPRTKENWM